MKLYFAKDSLFCYPLKHWKELLKDCGIFEMTVYPAVKIKIKDTIYCKHFYSIEEHECGKHCHAYAPRNGKNGACKNLGSIYEADYNKPLILTI